MICVINNIEMSNKIVESIIACVYFVAAKIAYALILRTRYIEVVIIIVERLSMFIIEDKHLHLHAVLDKVAPHFEVIVNSYHVNMILIAAISSHLIVSTVDVALCVVY